MKEASMDKIVQAADPRTLGEPTHWDVCETIRDGKVVKTERSPVWERGLVNGRYHYVTEDGVLFWTHKPLEAI